MIVPVGIIIWSLEAKIVSRRAIDRSFLVSLLRRHVKEQLFCWQVEEWFTSCEKNSILFCQFQHDWEACSMLLFTVLVLVLVPVAILKRTSFTGCQFQHDWEACSMLLFTVTVLVLWGEHPLLDPDCNFTSAATHKNRLHYAVSHFLGLMRVKKADRSKWTEVSSC